MTRTKNVHRERTVLWAINWKQPFTNFCFHADEAMRVLVGLALLGLALVGMIQLFHGWDAPRFYSIAKKKESFLLSALFPSERQCVLPVGIGSFATLARFENRYDVRDTTTLHADSDHDWFIVIFQNADPRCRVVTISEIEVALANTYEICGENLKVSFDQGGRAVISQ